MLFKVYYFSFPAVAACTFNWPRTDFLRKQGWVIWLTTPAFDCDRLKRKGNMESTVWKWTLESRIHENEKNIKSTVSVCWRLNKLMYGIAIADPKSTLKIDMRSRWTVFQILLMSGVICI